MRETHIYDTECEKRDSAYEDGRDSDPFKRDYACEEIEGDRKASKGESYQDEPEGSFPGKVSLLHFDCKHFVSVYLFFVHGLFTDLYPYLFMSASFSTGVLLV